MMNMPSIFWVVCTGILGAILGSYVNMAAYRLPRDISTITRTRSFCPSCKHPLAWFDNIPIFSYLFLSGRCRSCRALIGRRYLITELLVAALFVLSAYQYFVLNNGWIGLSGPRGTVFEPLVFFLVQLFLIADMVLLSVVDLEAWLIPIETTFPGTVLGFILAAACPELHLSASAWTANLRLNAVIDSFLGLSLGAGILWSIGFLTTFFSYYWFSLRGIEKRPLEGMGLGDVHLLGMVGALLGWKPALETIFLGVIIGSVTGVGKLLWEKIQRRRLGDKWKPWQPTYDISAEEEAEGEGEAVEKTRHWPVALKGGIVLVGAGYLHNLSSNSFSGDGIDSRMLPVYLIMLIGMLLLLAFPFMRYLDAIEMLPQGEIEEQESGEKQEVLQGNYVPFGPSLAAAVLIVAFYDPMIREVAYYVGMNAPRGPRTQFRVPADRWLGQSLIPIMRMLRPARQNPAGGEPLPRRQIAPVHPAVETSHEAEMEKFLKESHPIGFPDGEVDHPLPNP